MPIHLSRLGICLSLAAISVSGASPDAQAVDLNKDSGARSPEASPRLLGYFRATTSRTTAPSPASTIIIYDPGLMHGGGQNGYPPGYDPSKPEVTQTIIVQPSPSRSASPNPPSGGQPVQPSVVTVYTTVYPSSTSRPGSVPWAQQGQNNPPPNQQPRPPSPPSSPALPPVVSGPGSPLLPPPPAPARTSSTASPARPPPPSSTARSPSPTASPARPSPLGPLGPFGRPQPPGSPLSVTTDDSKVYCRPYPDLVSLDESKVFIFQRSTQIKVECWTPSSIQGDLGRILRDDTWLRTDRNCFIHESNILQSQDYSRKLPRCTSVPEHWVGELLPQYTRQDCYAGPTQNSPSIVLGNGRRVDLGCSITGDNFKGNSTWIRAKDTTCYLPAAIFDNKKYRGTRGPNC